MSSMEAGELREWIGHSESRSERISATSANLLNATLDSDIELVDGMTLPQLFHWLYFLPVCRQSRLDTDGHPVRGGFLPPIPLPRRMWAASALEFASPLIIGETVTRVSRILDIVPKHGRSGLLIFVKLEHVIANGAGRVALTEIQDLVYREKSGDVTPAALVPVSDVAAEVPRWSQRIQPDSTLLFRYSALTFNAHRIHYDVRYATEVEYYPALVVHGPLVATLLMQLLLQSVPGAHVKGFTFRAERPIFADAPMLLCAHPEEEPTKVRLWSCDASGARFTSASATIDPLTY